MSEKIFQVKWKAYVDVKADSHAEALKKGKKREADSRIDYSVVKFHPPEEDKQTKSDAGDSSE